ncbi:MAG: cupredoxin domain-containing protein [Candidatus Levybacteria bacterium]|nr:cupredoxin domain-containing protein [Candidatus Levybacteria bacterium]MBI4036666.1 cupredoxin domain-containing protein [Candidatus Daviesbacteria bacterium]
MNTDKILVMIFGLIGIVLTYWFFLMKKEREVSAESLRAGKAGEIDIKVSGGYSPEVISIPKGKMTKINFLRTDSTDCLSEVVLSDFKIRKQLPLNQRVTIEITPQKEGEFLFACGMNMYHGKLKVV